MADETEVPKSIPLPAKFILRPLEQGFATMEREVLAMGVPAHEVVGMVLNHLCSIVAHIEPPGARAACIADIQAALPDLIRQHVEARFKTPGGVMLPGAGT